jgi:hypothetical protein
VIAIEVKIDAEDQEHQLVRYQKELNRIYPSKEKYIFYLTKDGKPASENSLCCNKNDECNIRNEDCKIKGNGYRRISFQEDIYEWVKKIADGESEYDMASQFLEVLELEHNRTEKYLKLLKEKIEYPRIINTLAAAMPAMWDVIRQTFFDALADELCNNVFGFARTSVPPPLGNETWAVALTRDGQNLYFCYEKNFFLRTGYGDDQWQYLSKLAFNGAECQQLCTRNKKEAFNIKTFDASNDGLAEWFYNRDENIIKRIAVSANEFFKNQTTK